jgi:hypothetical protein
MSFRALDVPKREDLLKTDIRTLAIPSCCYCFIHRIMSHKLCPIPIHYSLFQSKTASHLLLSKPNRLLHRNRKLVVQLLIRLVPGKIQAIETVSMLAHPSIIPSATTSKTYQV